MEVIRLTDKPEEKKGMTRKEMYILIAVLAILCIAIIASFFIVGNALLAPAKENRAHKDILYIYEPTGQEVSVGLQNDCILVFHDITSGQVTFQDLSAPIQYRVEGGCNNNLVIQTIIWKNATTTVKIIDLDQTFKPNMAVSG